MAAANAIVGKCGIVKVLMRCTPCRDLVGVPVLCGRLERPVQMKSATTGTIVLMLEYVGARILFLTVPRGVVAACVGTTAQFIFLAQSQWPLSPLADFFW
jgi:hypothetical protein